MRICFLNFQEEKRMRDVLKRLHEERQRHQAYGGSRRVEAPPVTHRPFLGKAPILDADKCTGCGACMDVCVFEAILFDGVPSFDETRCEACGACIARCPADALRWPLGQQ